MSFEIERRSNEERNFVRELSDKAVLLSDRNYLLGTYCPQMGIDSSDLFAKARAYSEIVHQMRDLGVMQYGVPIESKPGPTVVMKFFGEHRKMIMFASNDYLNLSTDPRVHAAIRRALDEYGVGAGSSRVGTGYSYLHQELEAKLASRFGKEAAIVLPTGYDAIAAPIITLCSKADRVVIDGSSHACIMDGAHTSGATVRVFGHNQVDRLEDTLKRSRELVPTAGLLVVVEGAYSMDGDIAKLPEIVALCKRYGARLLVDEAHSIGVHGARGRGVVEHYGLADQVDMICGTFSKSLGATGGFVAADRDVITYLNYQARKVIFSAAFPPILAAGVMASLDILDQDAGLRERLWENIRYLGQGMKQIGAQILGTETASVPILIANDGIMFEFTQDLIKHGIFTFPAVYPTVPKNRSVFRLALQAKHERSHLDHTIEVFDKLLTKYGVGRSSDLHRAGA